VGVAVLKMRQPADLLSNTHSCAAFSPAIRNYGRLKPMQLPFVGLLQIIALAGVGILAFAGGAQGTETAITCTNTTSGTTWQIKVDYDQRTVDSNPAEISDAEISWHDRIEGGNYTLDRKSGKLTVIIASSTAGHFLYDRCRLEN
jgi:hypothetical protein